MRPWIKLLRPKQWIKNAFVFAPMFFAARFLDPESWLATGLSALCFLCAACTVYIVNDIHDRKEDQGHPVKKNRPLAAGTIGALPAGIMACGFFAASIFLLMLLPTACSAVIAIYLALNLLYTYHLKYMAIIDVFSIAFCYVLRVLMGGYALSVFISPWIILTTFLLALFLGFGKRYNEMGFEKYAQSKENLQHYNRDLLDRLVTICGCSALIAYAIYAAEMANRTGHVGIIYTTGFVAFGLFRYLQSIYVYHQGGEPEAIIFKDRLQLLNVVLWLTVTLWIISLA